MTNKDLENNKDLEKHFFDYIQSEQVEKNRKRRWNNIFRVVKYGTILGAVAFALLKSTEGTGFKTPPHIASITMSGQIGDGLSVDAELFVPAIQRAFSSPGSTEIILKINSPGGSPVHSGRIYREIEFMQAQYPDKKVTAVIDDIGASGGYYIAAAANEIYADPASVVGSIGVISSSFGFTELMDQIGVERRVFVSGEYKSLLDPYSPVPEKSKEHWQTILDDTHKQFIQSVKAGRGEQIKAAGSEKTVFTGQVWNGRQALSLGLIDGYGSLESLTRSDDGGQKNIIDYTPQEDFIKQLSNRARIEFQTLISSLSAIKLF